MRGDVNRDDIFGQSAVVVSKKAYSLLSKLDRTEQQEINVAAAGVLLLALCEHYGIKGNEVLDAAARWRRDANETNTGKALDMWMEKELK